MLRSVRSLVALAIVATSLLSTPTSAGAADPIHDRGYAVTQITDGGSPIGHAEPDGAGAQIVFAWQPEGADRPSVWIYDVATGERSELAAGNGASADPMISEDGKWVTFSSTSTDLTTDSDTSGEDVFLLELASGSIERITPGAGRSHTPTIDSDGNAISFVSTLTSLDPDRTATNTSVYRWTRDDGFDLVIAGRPLTRPENPVINGTGRLVVSENGSSNARWTAGDEPIEAEPTALFIEAPDINSSGSASVFQNRFGNGSPTISVSTRCCIATHGPGLLDGPLAANSVSYEPTIVGEEPTMVYVFRGSAHGDPFELRHTGPRALGTIFQSDSTLRRPSFGYSEDLLTFQAAATELDATPNDSDLDFYYWNRRSTPSCGGSELPWQAGDRPMEDQIVRLYQATFGRIPDQGGLQFWVEQRAAGQPLSAVAESFQQSPEWATRYGTEVPPSRIITLLYQNVLDRRPDQGGFDFWLGELADGRTLTDVVLAFTDSPENIQRTNTAAVQAADEGAICRVYQAVFDRVPDGGGFDFWLNQRRTGASLRDVVRQMTASPEWERRYGSTTGRQLVQAIYINVLGRAPDPAGENFWTNQVFGGLATEDLVLAFTESPENIVRTGTAP